MNRPMPIGVEDFEKIHSEGYYYVDKTLMIKEILDKKADVNLFTRPRRFGKTLALSMLKYYFEDAYDWNGNHIEHSGLFADKAIEKEDVRYRRHMGKYPVIFLMLKSGGQVQYEDCIWALKEQIASEFERHSYILKNEILTEREKKRYEDYMNLGKNDQEYKQSLKFLCRCLEKWSGKKVILLVDEYDVPLENAFHRGFYERMADFIRGLFESALKTNEFLYFSVITGCLRISKESIFTGLNNMKIHSILSKQYDEFFGFTEEEVRKMCRVYGLENKYDEIQEWYNGYLFGETRVYNPWSVIQYFYDHMDGQDVYPEAYWVNTSSNSIVRDLITHADEEQKQAVEALIAGDSIRIPVHEDITYDEVYKNAENLWNFMFFTGYLKKTAEDFDGLKRYLTLQIPNKEIKYIFIEKIRGWFQERVREMDRSTLFAAVVSGDALQEKAKEAVGQIIDMQYEQELFDDGYQNVKRYGIAFFKKNCLVVSG